MEGGEDSAHSAVLPVRPSVPTPLYILGLLLITLTSLKLVSTQKSCEKAGKDSQAHYHYGFKTPEFTYMYIPLSAVFFLKTLKSRRQ